MGKHGGNQGGRHTGTKTKIKELLEHGSMTSAEIRDATGFGKGAVEQALLRLRDHGEIVCDGPNRAGRWGLADRSDGSALANNWPLPFPLPSGVSRVVRRDD